MFIQCFPSGPFSTNAYIVACPNTRQAIIIDPAPGSTDSILTYIDQHPLEVTAIYLTHSHWDHIADVAQLKKFFKIPVYIHVEDAPNLRQPGIDGLPCWITIESVEPDAMLEDGQQFNVGQLQFQVIHTPGHSLGSVCFYEPQQHILLSGDTLFKGTIGNLSFPTSAPKRMWSSLDKLAKLPSQTIVYPGYGPKTTIGSETWLSNAQALFG